MKTTKKLLIALVLLLATVSVMTSCSIFIKNNENDPYPYLYVNSGYNEEYGGSFASVELLSYYEGAIPEDLVIPNSIDGKTITAIAISGFENCTDIKSVTLPDTITHIGRQAFAGCTSLTSINIPSSVKYIGGKTWTDFGAGAFEGCTSLTEITIADSYMQIGRNAFYNTGYYNDFGNWDGDVLYIGKHLVSTIELLEGNYKIKEGTLNLADEVFGGRDLLTSVEIPESIIELPEDLFSGCERLETVSFSGNSKLTTIGESAFYSCYGITSIAIPENVTTIGDDAFSSCNLESISLGDNSKLTTIGNDAFAGCDFEEITLPESLVSIGDTAFSGAPLSSITIPRSVKEIGAGVFANCGQLTEIGIDENNKYFRVIDGNLYSRDGKTLVMYAPGKSGGFYIPESVTTIGAGAFRGCETLSYVGIDDKVTRIEEYAFSGCYKLESIHIPNSITYIGRSAFEYCNSLTRFEFSEGMTEIEQDVLYNCDSLESIVIPKSITAISHLFGWQKNVTDVYYTGSEAEWNSIEMRGNEIFTDMTIHYNYVPEN